MSEPMCACFLYTEKTFDHLVPICYVETTDNNLRNFSTNSPSVELTSSEERSLRQADNPFRTCSRQGGKMMMKAKMSHKKNFFS